MIKNPLELNVGLLRQLEYEVPDSSDLKIQYGFWQQIRALGKLQDLELGDPPDVAGWPAWYRVPLYNQVWINTATIPIRYSYIKKIITGSVGPYSKAEKLYFNPFKIAYSTPEPSNINVLVPTLANLLFPQTANEELIAELKEVLNPGLPDFEWTVEWNKYVENPADENQKKVISKHLKDLLYTCVQWLNFN